MKTTRLVPFMAFAFFLFTFVSSAGALDAAVQAKIDTKKADIESWGKDPAIVAAVKAFNTTKPAYAKGMTQDEWTKLSIVDPKVREILNSDVSKWLKGKKADWVAEAFVSGSDGTKVGFLQKSTNWSHTGKPKHDDPMKNKIYIGALERDESTGIEEIQIGVPVLDGTTPIGSLVVGIRIDKL